MFAVPREDVPLELPEERVLRPVPDQGIDLADVAGAVAGAVVGDRARIACRQAGVALRINALHVLRQRHEAVELGANEIVAQLQLRRILLSEVGALLDGVAQLCDARALGRVAEQIGIEVGIGAVLLAELFEGLQHTPARLARRVEIAQSGLVGRCFLAAALGEKAADDDLVGRQHGLGLAGGNRRADAEQPQQQQPGLLLCSRDLDSATCAPSICPTSCAITPITWFGVSACMMVPI